MLSIISLITMKMILPYSDIREHVIIQVTLVKVMKSGLFMSLSDAN